MQTRKKQTQKGKASPPKSILTPHQESKIRLLRNERRVMLELFHLHQNDFEILQSVYITLKKEHSRICNVLLDTIKNTSDLLKLFHCVEQGEEWKPETEKLFDYINTPVHLN